MGALVTKVPVLNADDATLRSGMDDVNNPAPPDKSCLDEVDQERLRKIAKIKQAIADGTYHVSSQDIAQKIIEHMRERDE
jgi:anti-sigma28 factor (negative regulator of flagellin synthesis)